MTNIVIEFPKMNPEKNTIKAVLAVHITNFSVKYLIVVKN